VTTAAGTQLLRALGRVDRRPPQLLTTVRTERPEEPLRVGWLVGLVTHSRGTVEASFSVVIYCKITSGLRRYYKRSGLVG
jgi:hypothetical protein